MPPPENQAANGENKRQPAVSGETSPLDSIIGGRYEKEKNMVSGSLKFFPKGDRR
jgi:hypothetical protein